MRFCTTLCSFSIVLFCTVILAANSFGAATTETNCTFGMAKGDKAQSCEVPIPSGCSVASFPGYEEPWTNISKGGLTTCQFDKDHSDWKSKIVGSCTTCRSDNCSATFSVVFNCGLQPYESQKKSR